LHEINATRKMKGNMFFMVQVFICLQVIKNWSVFNEKDIVVYAFFFR